PIQDLHYTIITRMDTRYDRVMEILDRVNSLDFMEEIIEKSLCLVAGSTWIEDQEILVDYINNTARENLKVVIAPHKIEGDQIKKLKNSIKKNVVLYSKMDQEIIGQAKVLIVDTVGLLTRIYSYADIAYVG